MVKKYPQIFPADWKPATATAKELLDGAVWRRRALQSSSSVDDSMDSKEEDLHAATMEEVRLGHLQGPFTKQQIDERFGNNAWLFTKRFALIQGTQRTRRLG